MDELSRSSDRPKGFIGKLAPLRNDVEAGRYGSGKKGARSFRASMMPDLLKGYGQHLPGNGIDIDEVGRLGPKFQQPLNDIVTQERLEQYACATLDKVISKGLTRPDKVYKSLSQNGSPIGASLRMMNSASGQGVAMAQFMSQLRGQLKGSLRKNFSLSSPLSSGFVPFDLMPFVRTIYPVYTPLRNKIPRVPGQGTYHRGKILSSITGSLPGGLGSLQDDSTSEFFGGSFASWPNQLPASGTQNAYDLIVPYKFFALTEGVSWLQQFSGQGFDDVYGLASLVLLQEFMLLEEHDILASSSQALAQPAAPTATARNATAGTETALTFTGTDVWIMVTALDYWGETQYTAGNVTEVTNATTGTSVIDVTISPVNGAIGYAIYVATGTANPGRTGFFRFQLNTQGGFTGSHRFTLQGAIPTTGANPPSADTGTSSSNRQESLFSVLSDRAYNNGNGPYPGSGSSPAVNAGYKNLSVGNIFGISVLQTALQQMFNGQNGYLANPSEIITSANDALALANSITSESVAAYQLRIQQSEVAGVLAGVAVSNVVNPITRSMPEILVHPYLPQGNALLMSYTLPQTQNNLGNVVENVMVQDYAQIGWPVIDPTFRQSILRYGLLWFAAPQYCGILGGLQVSATTPYS
jgi:hypothetical protein